VCGTLDYIAPEVIGRKNTIFGRTRYGKGADMWSLGVVVYVLLTATTLFPDTANLDDVRGVKERVKEALSGPDWNRQGLSLWAKEFVSSLLEVNQDRRLTARKALNHPWIKSAERATPVVLPAAPTTSGNRIENGPGELPLAKEADTEKENRKRDYHSTEQKPVQKGATTDSPSHKRAKQQQGQQQEQQKEPILCTNVTRDWARLPC
jgi:serine/threonine protein kinase